MCRCIQTIKFFDYISQSVNNFKSKKNLILFRTIKIIVRNNRANIKILQAKIDDHTTYLLKVIN